MNPLSGEKDGAPTGDGEPTKGKTAKGDRRKVKKAKFVCLLLCCGDEPVPAEVGGLERNVEIIDEYEVEDDARKVHT